MPTSVLFARVWQDNADRRDSTKLEQQGVEYLTALFPLISALAEAQSSALSGVTEPPDSLAGAVARVAAADAALGDSLKTKERWTGLKEKIDKLSRTNGDPLTLLRAHSEVSDLALALFAAIRRNSALNRDPDNDLSNLQQAATIDMPTTVVRVSRMGDYANVLQGTTGAARGAVTVQFGQEVLAVQESVNSLTESLQAAVDDTNSSTLSGSLVSTLDSFRRGVESMTRGANPGGSPNVATMSTAQTALQTALNSLSGVTLKEMDGLLDKRMDSLDYRRIEALVMAGIAVILVLIALLWPALGRRRQDDDPAPLNRPVGESTRDIALNRPAGPPPGYGNPYDQVPAYGQVGSTQREQSGALR